MTVPNHIHRTLAPTQHTDFCQKCPLSVLAGHRCDDLSLWFGAKNWCRLSDVGQFSANFHWPGLNWRTRESSCLVCLILNLAAICCNDDRRPILVERPCRFCLYWELYFFAGIHLIHCRFGTVCFWLYHHSGISQYFMHIFTFYT